MNDSTKIREQMDACRPNMSDELLSDMQELATALDRDPQVRDDFARSQQLDARVRDAFQDVDVPTGLESRLLAALASAGQESASTENDDAAVALPTLQNDEPRADGKSRTTRRRWMWGAGVATAASIAGGFVVYNGMRRDLTVEEVCEGTPEWLASLDQAAWEPNGDIEAGRSMPTGLRPRGWEWQTIRTPLGKTLVLQTATADGSNAYLLIAPAKASETLRSRPPSSPANSTGTYRIGVWGSDTHVFVLAVEGGDRAYQSLIGRSNSIG